VEYVSELNNFCVYTEKYYVVTSAPSTQCSLCHITVHFQNNYKVYTHKIWYTSSYGFSVSTASF
jgi:uncharacterized membrane protein